jgi:rubrerythrin
MEQERKKPSTPREILEEALAREKAAYKFYDEMSKNTKITILRETLEELRDEEYAHIKKLKNRILWMDLS